MKYCLTNGDVRRKASLDDLIADARDGRLGRDAIVEIKGGRYRACQIEGVEFGDPESVPSKWEKAYQRWNSVATFFKFLTLISGILVFMYLFFAPR